MFREIILPIFRSTRLCVTVCVRARMCVDFLVAPLSAISFNPRTKILSYVESCSLPQCKPRLIIWFLLMSCSYTCALFLPRTYYRSKVLQPVPRLRNLPRKLVYKFNPAVIHKVAAMKLSCSTFSGRGLNYNTINKKWLRLTGKSTTKKINLF